jgi:hypothetical protein
MERNEQLLQTVVLHPCIVALVRLSFQPYHTPCKNTRYYVASRCSMGRNWTNFASNVYIEGQRRAYCLSPATSERSTSRREVRKTSAVLQTATRVLSRDDILTLHRLSFLLVANNKQYDVPRCAYLVVALGLAVVVTNQFSQVFSNFPATRAATARKATTTNNAVAAVCASLKYGCDHIGRYSSPP